MDARLLKEKALQYFQKGKFAKAAEVWVQVCKAEPKDNQSRLRMGDALSKAGQAEKAFEAYRTAAEGFAKAGFLPQATAAAKLALGLKPHAVDVQALVAELHAERFGRPPTPAVEGPPPFESSRSRAPLPPPRVPGPPPFLSSSSSLKSIPPEPIEPEPDEAPVEPAPGGSAELESYIDEALELAGAPIGDEVAPAPPPPPEDITGPSIPKPVRRPPFRRVRPPDGEALAAEPEVTSPRPPPIGLDDGLRPDATLLGAPALMEELRLRSSEQDSTVVAMNPLALVPPPPTNPEQPRHDDDAAVAGGARRGEYPRVPLFDELSTDAFLALLKECPLNTYSIHEVVLEQGRPGDSFFVILAGRVRVFREEPSGRRELAILEEGAFFGEMALLTGAPRSAWVVAEVEATRLLEISAPVVQKLAAQYASVAEGLATLAKKRILSNVMASEPLFAGLKRNERLALADRFEAQEAESGRVLLSKGAAPAGLVVVISGQVTRSGPDGGARVYGSGTLVGDLETLEGVVGETVEVHRPGLLLTLPADEVSRLLTHPSLGGKQASLVEAARRRLGV